MDINNKVKSEHKVKSMIAVGGTAANFPHLGHKKLLQILIESQLFEAVIWVVSGDRPDKTNLVEAHLRAQMSQALLQDMLKANGVLKLDLDDTREGGKTFRTTMQLLDQYQARYPKHEIVMFTGLDLLIPKGGKCEIEATWQDGQEIMKRPIAAVARPGFETDYPSDLPNNIFIIEGETDDISSSDGRSRIRHGLPWEHLTAPGVVAIIKKHNLYGYKA